MKRIFFVGLTPTLCLYEKAQYFFIPAKEIYFSTVKLLMIAARITGIAITIVNVSIILSFQSF